MAPDFSSMFSALRAFVFPLIHFFDPALHAFLISSSVEPFYALSWIITWYSHDCRDVSTASRLFDAFLAAHPLLPLYMSVALVCHPVNRLSVLSVECEFASVHAALCSLPNNMMAIAEGGESVPAPPVDDSAPPALKAKGAVDYQDVLDKAISMMRAVPPRNLAALSSRYFLSRSRASRPSPHPSPDLSSIAMVRQPPAWCLSGSTPADWSLLLAHRARAGKSGKIVSKAGGVKVRHNGGGRQVLAFDDGTGGDKRLTMTTRRGGQKGKGGGDDGDDDDDARAKEADANADKARVASGEGEGEGAKDIVIRWTRELVEAAREKTSTRGGGAIFAISIAVGFISVLLVIARKNSQAAQITNTF